MDFIQNLNLGTTAQISLILAVVFCLTQAVKQTGIENRWMPWLSMVIGVVAGLVSALLISDANYLSSGVLGLLIGGFTSGLFDGFKGFSGKDEK
ncbi:holin [Lentilactobacillus buchneri]|uniref:holin n=1 Tax=Lentilactobacillus buchneri TaxID=1581 RepID=UPI0012929902|nr:holin [Lentilactobacillus buchneri]MQM78818.1 hypothetical protein [Lentilactobacillus buchneri]MQM88872.1 hypothetical protein [Lentilactobacillus buchneri]MQN21021.1 hypothetical protein [Lentilactobacillus buchneri]